MAEMFTVHNADTGAQLRPNKFSSPAAALAYGYAWVDQQSVRCPVHGIKRRTRAAQPVPWCGCADFVVKDEQLRPLSGSRCIALALHSLKAVAS